jgi:isoleucyl-tRNA synthetase
VLTHGFTMDARGEKMSKSKGNTVDPIKVMETYGADIIRLWALSVDYTEDHRIGEEILKGVSDQYRKIRNTFRYLLGALADFDESEKVDVAQMPELERYILALLGRLDATLRRAVDDFDFNTYTREIGDFCNEDLSAFFFDIRKDCLYCDAPADPKRRAYRTVLDALFHALVRYAAPVLVFTAEEVWRTRCPDSGSVHLLEWPDISSLIRHSRESGNPETAEELGPRFRGDDELLEKWLGIRSARSLVTQFVEVLRREKKIGSSLEADVEVRVADASVIPNLQSIDFAEICITATAEVLDTTEFDDRASVTRTSHHKCGRCWRHLAEVAQDGALCGRCETVVDALEAPA